MFNTQLNITEKLTKSLEKCIMLNEKLLKNLIAIILGIIISKSCIPADMVPELKDSYSKGTRPSVKKRIKRFLYTKLSNYLIYHYFARYLLKNYKPSNNTIQIIFDHTTCDNRFTILQFAMRIGKRTIPIWFKIFEYEDKDSLNRSHVKEGLKEIKELFKDYKYEIVILADRAFRDIDLFETIESHGFKFAIRVVGNTNVEIPNRKNIKKLEDIGIKPGEKKLFKNVKLTEKNYVCNVGVYQHEEEDDVWYVVTNMSPRRGIREYCKRFDIEEMFRDLKSNGFNLEGTWTKDLTYFTNLYMCISIAYTWMICLGSSCSKDKRNAEIGAVKKTKENKIIRIYSLFRTGLMWFKMCYYSETKRYLKCDFVLYHC